MQHKPPRRRGAAIVLALLLALAVAVTAVFAFTPADYQTDADFDNIPDFKDSCPAAGDLYGFGILNNGCAENDSDGDNMPDRFDLCPAEGAPAPNQHIDNDGCLVTPATLPADADGDGLPNDLDACRNQTLFVLGIKNNGCAVTDNDGDAMPTDLDTCAYQTVIDGTDTFPFTFGLNNNGCGHVDADGDGVPNEIDTCPSTPGTLPNGCPDPAAISLRGAGASGGLGSLPPLLLVLLVGLGSTAVLRRRR